MSKRMLELSHNKRITLTLCTIPPLCASVSIGNSEPSKSNKLSYSASSNSLPLTHTDSGRGKGGGPTTQTRRRDEAPGIKAGL